MPNSHRYKILAICGSTRKSSSNLELIHAINDLYKGKLDIEIFHGIDEIPHFNPDLDGENPPEKTISFRQKLTGADGILICTPEYAMGVPGTLKNALDWTVSSMEFSHKPVALITASSVGQKAHASLMETLKVIESDIPETSQLVISFAKTKVNGNKIIDDNTLQQVRNTIDSLMTTIEKKRITHNMIHLIRTDSDNSDFIALVAQLDAFLAEIDGEEHLFYNQLNKVANIKHVVVAYEDNRAVGCGAIREFNETSMEVKRMYTLPASRGKGIAKHILNELEKWAMELGYLKCILETGKRQPEAIQLYSNNGYKAIPNYGKYANVYNSICFEKELSSLKNSLET